MCEDKKNEEYYYPNNQCELVQELDDGSKYYLLMDVYSEHVDESANTIKAMTGLNIFISMILYHTL